MIGNSRSSASTLLQPSTRAVVACFVIVGSLLLPFYRYELTPDSISYVSIASQYVAGYWNEAVNAYWAPLYCWFIAGLLLLRIPPPVALKVLGLGIGALALIALRRLSMHFRLSPGLRSAVLWVSAVMILAFVMESNTPDLLLTTILLFYFVVIFDPAYSASRYAGALCGLLGGLAYLSKGYGLFFFGAHFVLMSALRWFFAKEAAVRRRLVQHFSMGLGVSCAISFPWMLVLHTKYNVWTTSTTGDFNFRLVGPESAGYPHFRHLIPPVSEHAITAWQSPSPSWLPRWSPLSSEWNLRHEEKLLYLNTIRTLKIWRFTSPLFALFVIGYVLSCSRIRALECVYPLLAIALFSAGYLPVTVEARYLWVTDLLLLLVSFCALEALFARLSFSALSRALITCVAVLSFLPGPILTLRAHFERDRSLYLWSEAIKRTGRIGGRLASCGNWAGSAYLAFILGTPYYGVPYAPPEADDLARVLNPDYRPTALRRVDERDIAGRLSGAGIKYYIQWPSCATPPLPGTPAAAAGDIQVLPVGTDRGNM